VVRIETERPARAECEEFAFTACPFQFRTAVTRLKISFRCAMQTTPVFERLRRQTAQNEDTVMARHARLRRRRCRFDVHKSVLLSR